MIEWYSTNWGYLLLIWAVAFVFWVIGVYHGVHFTFKHISKHLEEKLVEAFKERFGGKK